MLTQGQEEIARKLREDPNAFGERLDTKAAAEFIGLSPSTLETMRSNEPERIPFISIGRKEGRKGGRVLYFKKHLTDYLASCMVGV